MNFRHNFTPHQEMAEPDGDRPERSEGVYGRGRLRSACVTGLGLAALWAGLHWSDPASWVIGVPTVLLGSAATMLLPTIAPPRLSVWGAVRFGLFAIRGITLGALDVTRGSLFPGTLRPGCLSYATRLPAGPPRRLFANAITLLPGTLTARIDDATLLVHALDTGTKTRGEIADLEARVAELFGLDTTE